VAELLFMLEQDGLISAADFSPYEQDTIQVLTGLLEQAHG
jgi:hypothetical protein